MKITEEKLVSAGYQRWQSKYKKFSDFFYQRCIKDKIGRRYFINLFHYAANIEGIKMPESWVAELQIDSDVSFKLEIFSLEDKSIGYVEKKFKLFWETFGRHYYEKFN